MSFHSWFNTFAKKAAWVCGAPSVFAFAAAVVALWLLSGPFFGFSDTWQLVINTTTSILTFLMVFLLQSSQNRDTAAMHVKLDELIRAQNGAHNAMIGLEDMSQDELLKLQKTYAKLAVVAKKEVSSGDSDIDCPHLEKAVEQPREPHNAV